MLINTGTGLSGSAAIANGIRTLGSSTTASPCSLRSSFAYGKMLFGCISAPTGTIHNTTAIPVGYRLGGAWMIPIQTGGCAAAIRASSELSSAIEGWCDVLANLLGEGTLTGSATMLKDIIAVIEGVGQIIVQVIGRGEMACTIKVNELTQSDVEGAVLDTPIEGSYSLRQLIRLVSSILFGKTSIDNGPPVIVRFRDLADTKPRITAQMDGSERIEVTKDAS